MSFHFGIYHSYGTPKNAEIKEWGGRVYQLVSLITNNGDREKLLEYTKKILDAWNSDLYYMGQKTNTAEPYKSSPDKILMNRYHILQTVAFDKLQIWEILEEDKTDKNDDETFIHPWTLTARYVKSVLKKTNNKYRTRLVGSCRVLRHYKINELSGFFDRTILETELIAHNNFTKNDVDRNASIEQYFKDTQNKLFGSKSRSTKLINERERFKNFSEIGDGETMVKLFQDYSDDWEVIEWIEAQLEHLLAPWGSYELGGLEEKVNMADLTASYFALLKAIPTRYELPLKPVIYCSADELLMSLITHPKMLEEFVNQKLTIDESKSTDQIYRKLRLPVMKENNKYNSSEKLSQPVVLTWTEQERDEIVYNFRKSIDFRKQGWQAEYLCVNVNENFVFAEEISGTNDFELSLMPTELIDFFLRLNDTKVLLYHLKIDIDQLCESLVYEDYFTAEGGQILTWKLVPQFIGEELNGYKLRFKYAEPWTWKYRRHWAKRSYNQLVYAFLQNSTAALIPAAILLFVLLSAWFLIYRQQNKEQPLIAINPLPSDSPSNKFEENTNEADITEHKEKLAVSENNPVNSVPINSPDRKLKVKNVEKNRFARSMKRSSGNSQANREELAVLSENPQEKLAEKLAGNPADTRLNPDLIALAVPSRAGGLINKSFPLYPNATYVRAGKVDFKWNGIAEAVEYHIEIRDKNDNFVINTEGKPVVRIETNATRVEPAVNFLPGEAYLWKLTAKNEAEKEIFRTEGSFSVLPSTAMERINVAEKKYASSSLLLGIFYLKNGLTEEAVAKFEEYAVQNPKSKIVHKLIKRAKANRIE